MSARLTHLFTTPLCTHSSCFFFLHRSNKPCSVRASCKSSHLYLPSIRHKTERQSTSSRPSLRPDSTSQLKDNERVFLFEFFINSKLIPKPVLCCVHTCCEPEIFRVNPTFLLISCLHCLIPDTFHGQFHDTLPSRPRHRRFFCFTAIRETFLMPQVRFEPITWYIYILIGLKLTRGVTDVTLMAGKHSWVLQLTRK